ncbi:ParM/StbA family protein [Clostridium butyricum]|uniref:ParM/StbA family protein n=1 Tax=Clostridium butyricum TaxID=1492 RepID=UPI0005C1E18D|nr:ParM/StbA family protein [Clostridium butyricum]KIU07789.1 hypothetical protein SC08_Contig83orf01711 [Clostridium butyricum]MBA8967620.1 plasmid segregation protein ParM [Clostridium butyricum]MBA8971313.1 plasmid segregation protein ParM [Clostridium butyricum]MBC2429375.1 ParM/StbA family protein [Clostridium butyricum]NOW36821.1 plasmid segregation protein ParM [Clostridium butyricum]
MKKILIAIDTGKHTTKAITKINGEIIKIKFRTKVKKVDNLGVDITPGSFLVEFLGETFLIGDMLSESTCNFDITKCTEEHIISIYTSICRILDKLQIGSAIPEIHLVINTPINIYKNKELKDEYKYFIESPNKVLNLLVNSKSYSFKISSVTLCPEAVGSVYLNSSIYKEKKVTIIDIGSLNTTFCTYKNLVPQLDSMVVANAGVNILRAKIAEKLTSDYGIMINDDDIEQILKDGYLKISGQIISKSRSEIETMLMKHVSTILNYGKSREISYNNTDIIFVGGGSILLKKYILSQCPNALIAEDAQFSNCLSYLKILEIKNGQK